MEPEYLNEMSITKKEKEILDHLANAWNTFVSLEHRHPSEVVEMERAIHQAQYLIAARVASRVDPHVWAPRG